ncbi:hypothetical protein KSH_05205 [Moraxella osloensis]|nr:hypothetical protein KSH_05205 [Moraxella osloensis]
MSIPKLSEIIRNNNPLAKLLLLLSVTKFLKRKRVKPCASRCTRNKAIVLKENFVKSLLITFFYTH